MTANTNINIKIFPTQNLGQQSKKRAIPKKVKRLCGPVCVICGFDRVVQYAHIIPESRGGTVHKDNIMSLCPNHHALFDRNLLTEEEKFAIKEHLTIAFSSPDAIKL